MEDEDVGAVGIGTAIVIPKSAHKQNPVDNNGLSLFLVKNSI
jgi:hypothetical protein